MSKSRKPNPDREITRPSVVRGDKPGIFNLRFVSADGQVWKDRKEMRLPAGKHGMWELEYLHQGRPIKPGGGLLAYDLNLPLSCYYQQENPRDPCYVSWESDTKAEVEMKIRAGNDTMMREAIFHLVVKKGELSAGESVVCRIGDLRQGGPGTRVHPFASEGELHVGVDLQGEGEFKGLSNLPLKLEVEALPHVDYHRLVLPSVVGINQDFAMTFTAWDLYRNPCTMAAGRFELDSPDGVRGLPRTIEFLPQHKGVLDVTGIHIAEEGIYRVRFRDMKTGTEGWSNPVMVQASPKQHIYWGDIHCHAYGDRSGYIRVKTEDVDPVRRNQDMHRIGSLDFAALSSMNVPEDQREVWSAYQEGVEKSESETFIPFLAKEFHTRPGGDRVVLWRDGSDIPLDTFVPVQELYEEYKSREDVLIQCHVGGGQADWDSFTPEDESLLEIASGHGNFEWFLQDALDRDLHPAVVGSSDGHHDLAGAPRGLFPNRGRCWDILRFNDSGFRSGPVAALFSPELTRDKLWESLQGRSSYATTGARILLAFSVNGKPMGARFDVRDAPRLEIEVHGTNTISQVDIIRGKHLLKRYEPQTLDFKETLNDISLPADGSTWYYVRVRQIDGEYAWSTPVWVTNAGFVPREDQELAPWHEPLPAKQSQTTSKVAEKYIPQVMELIEREWQGEGKLSSIQSIGIVQETAGTAALFHAYIEPQHSPVSIRWYFELEMPLIHLDYDLQDFGVGEVSGPQLMKQCGK